MKVVVAIDSFKGSLSSIEAGNAVQKGILTAHPDAMVVVKPLTDGSEGTTDADVVVTGEGRLDAQTAMGKTPIGVARLAKKYNAKVIAFSGSVTGTATAEQFFRLLN